MRSSKSEVLQYQALRVFHGSYGDEAQDGCSDANKRHIGGGFGVGGMVSEMSEKSFSSTIALYLFSEQVNLWPVFLVCYGQRGVGWKGIPLCSECVLYYVYSFIATCFEVLLLQYSFFGF